MDMDAQKLIHALQEKSGMFTHTAVNALKQHIGTVKNVKVFQPAQEVKFLIQITLAHALQAMFGQKISAFIHHAMEVKLGLDQNVFAQSDSIITVLCA